MCTQALAKLLPAADGLGDGRRLARSDSRGHGTAADTVSAGSVADFSVPTSARVADRAGDVLLAALTYLIEAADEHAAPWGWCR